jgi:hypothetical protein
MSYNTRRSRASIDPHGYLPFAVNEKILSVEESREELLDSLHGRVDPARRVSDPDWRSALTAEELAKLKQIETTPRRTSAFHLCGFVPGEQEEIVYEFVRRGRLRLYARQKYANGEAVWFGDGPPPWER